MIFRVSDRFKDFGPIFEVSGQFLGFELVLGVLADF